MGETAKKAPKCAICAKPAVERYRPFCSKRCADIDLYRWLGGNYRIPTEEIGMPEEEEAAAEAAEYRDKHD